MQGFFNPQKGMSSCRRCTGIAFAEAGSAKCDRICMCQKVRTLERLSRLIRTRPFQGCGSDHVVWICAQPWLVGLILLSLLTLVGIGVWIARRVDGVLMRSVSPSPHLDFVKMTGVYISLCVDAKRVGASKHVSEASREQRSEFLILLYPFLPVSAACCCPPQT